MSAGSRLRRLARPSGHAVLKGMMILKGIVAGCNS
jgi:hypothetical protein